MLRTSLLGTSWSRVVALGVGDALLTITTTTLAQPTPDHLKCYKFKDTQAKQTYTADLTGLTAEPDCTINVPAAELCVAATKANVNPSPPDGGPVPNPAGRCLMPTAVASWRGSMLNQEEIA